jgi:hypothetical protein
MKYLLKTSEGLVARGLQSETENTMSNSMSTLLLRNLSDVFGENDPVRRRAAIDEIFHEDAVFYDPKGRIFRGRDEIDRASESYRDQSLQTRLSVPMHSVYAAHPWAASRKESRIARTVALKLKTRESPKKTDSLLHGSKDSTSRPSLIKPRREQLQQWTCWQALYQSCPPPSSAHEKRARGRS